MFKIKTSVKKIMTTIGVAGCILTSVPLISFAQGGSGLTIFSGVDRENILNYYLDFNGQRNNRDRYRLRIPGKKLMQGATKFFVFYPDYFDGKFEEDKIEVRIDGEPLALRNVMWDRENYLIQIELEEPITESRKVELVFSGVRNPDVGTYYFRGEVLPAVGVPARQYIGTWIISINP